MEVYRDFAKLMIVRVWPHKRGRLFF